MQMSNVNFIITELNKPNEIAKFIIELLESKWDLNSQWLILTPEVEILSNHLWTAKTLSFLPHKNESSPIVIQDSAENLDKYVGVINLSEAAMLSHNNVIELVFLDEKQKKISREKYKTYKQHKFNLTKEEI